MKKLGQYIIDFFVIVLSLMSARIIAVVSWEGFLERIHAGRFFRNFKGLRSDDDVMVLFTVVFSAVILSVYFRSVRRKLTGSR